MNTTKAMSFESFQMKPQKSKIIARNTFEWYKPTGVRVIRLHYTDIIEIANDRVVLNSGGYRTPTTKERMNRFQDQATIYQGKGVWYVKGKNDDHACVYYDGIVIDGGKCTGENHSDKEYKRIQKDLKLIKRYIDKMKKLDKLPIPDNGDCLYCRVGKTSEYCVREHLKEQYVHGSLIYNALKWKGYEKTIIPYMIFEINKMRDRAYTSVRDYMKHHLGIAR